MGISFRIVSGLPRASTRTRRTSQDWRRSASASSKRERSRRAPQPGKPKPRMWRLPKADALINRLGFNNDGVAHFVANIAESSYPGVLGINIGRNFDTPNERARRTTT